MRKLSLATRLTLWYLAIFALTELVFGAASWFVLQSNLYELVDNNLESQIADLQSFLGSQKDASLATLQQKVNERYASQHAGDYLELYLQPADLVYRSTFLQSHPALLLPPDRIKRPIFHSFSAEGRHFRFAFAVLHANGRIFIAEMGIPADDAVRTLQMFRAVLLILAPLLLLLAAAAGHKISRRILAGIPGSYYDRSA
jgi:hypothetical protein